MPPLNRTLATTANANTQNLHDATGSNGVGNGVGPAYVSYVEPTPQLRAQARSSGAPHQIRQAERDRARASIGTSTPYNSPRAPARKPHLSPRSLHAQARSRGAPQIRQAERDRAKASVGTSTPYNPPRAPARKPHLSQRSLRAQARSRGAPRHTHRAPAFVEVAVFIIARSLLCKNADYSIGPVG